ncbi:MAG TPA: site-2 protease family protein [Candidatus Hydrogenedens sp.]|nr:site-2 protease family protein [Candidatus Hydrogenedens sp.]
MANHILQIAVQYICLLFCLSAHEAAHAAAADRCGDPTARMLGRLTLNPIKHADPLGTFILPLLMMITQIPFLFGWAKPVPVNPRNFRNPKTNEVFVAMAGPGANLILAIVFTFILRLTVIVNGITTLDEMFLSPVCLISISIVMINLVLLLFNCIPLPPLDGYHVLNYFLPPEGEKFLQQMGPFGIIIAITLGSRIISIPLKYIANFLLIYSLTGFNIF